MSYPRAGRVLAVAFLLVTAAFVGCGRASLLGYESDAGPDARTEGGNDGSGFDANFEDVRDGGGGDADAGVCNAKNCPTGCCDSAGKCRNGTELTGCGGPGGIACVDCAGKGFDFCDATRRVCAREVKVCDGTTCADGCCGPGLGDAGLACYDGVSDKACGTGAATCAVCGAAKDAGVTTTCDPKQHTCVSPTCNAKTCNGCCDKSGKCQPGDANTVCGAGGMTCTDCTQQNASCVASGITGGACEGPPPLCGPDTCPNGCCLGDTCLDGNIDTACGVGGKECLNCMGQNQVCTGQACVPPPPTCTAANCPGCCDPSGTCFAGFLNTRCGSGGSTCADCSSTGSTCNGSVTPRVCANQQSTCPASYPTCDPSVTEAPAPNAKGSCDPADLQDAQQACSQGAASPACNSFFDFLASTNGKQACGQCLAPFHYTFQESRGIFTCVQPFASGPCNHRTGCAIDCADTSCSQCPSGSELQCENNVEAVGGQCRPFFNQTGCISGPLLGAAAFCNPATYPQRNYGAWLAGVGTHYCAP